MNRHVQMRTPWLGSLRVLGLGTQARRTSGRKVNFAPGWDCDMSLRLSKRMLQAVLGVSSARLTSCTTQKRPRVFALVGSSCYDPGARHVRVVDALTFRVLLEYTGLIELKDEEIPTGTLNSNKKPSRSAAGGSKRTSRSPNRGSTDGAPLLSSDR